MENQQHGLGLMSLLADLVCRQDTFMQYEILFLRVGDSSTG